jgi:Holliday junction resolvasome RuvABC endonuclease subunit
VGDDLVLTDGVNEEMHFISEITDGTIIQTYDPMEYQEAEAFMSAYQETQKRVGGEIRGSLDSIIKKYDVKAALLAASSVKNKIEGDKTAEMIASYAIYEGFLNLSEDTPKQVKEAIVGGVVSKLKDIIQGKIKKERPEYSDEEAEKWAEYTAIIAQRDPTYVQKIVKEEKERIEKEVSKKDIASYLTRNVEKDEEYARVGVMLYQASKEEED